jgi:hypothetical protein
MQRDIAWHHHDGHAAPANGLADGNLRERGIWLAPAREIDEAFAATLSNTAKIFANPSARSNITDGFPLPTLCNS